MIEAFLIMSFAFRYALELKSPKELPSGVVPELENIIRYTTRQEE
jgi:hypothetical protein